MKQHVADILSYLRAVLVVPVGYFTLTGHWKLAFFVILLAWATDLIDGAAAKRWSSWTSKTLQLDLDGIADSVLAFPSTAFIWIYYALSYHIVLASALGTLWVVTIASALLMILVMDKPNKTQTDKWTIRINMILMHAVVQIGATLSFFAYMAEGLSGLIPMMAVLIVVSVLQRYKVALWAAGKLR